MHTQVYQISAKNGRFNQFPHVRTDFHPDRFRSLINFLKNLDFSISMDWLGKVRLSYVK